MLVQAHCFLDLAKMDKSSIRFDFEGKKVTVSNTKDPKTNKDDGDCYHELIIELEKDNRREARY